MAAAADRCCFPLPPCARGSRGLQSPPIGPDHRFEAGVPVEHLGRWPVHHPGVRREPSDPPRPDRRSGRDHQAIGEGARGGALVDLRALPKVELHRHLEGSVRLSTVFELSRRAGIELPADSPEELARHALITSPVDGLEKALEAFAITQNSIRTYDAVRRSRTLRSTTSVWRSCGSLRTSCTGREGWTGTKPLRRCSKVGRTRWLKGR